MWILPKAAVVVGGERAPCRVLLYTVGGVRGAQRASLRLERTKGGGGVVPFFVVVVVVVVAPQ